MADDVMTVAEETDSDGAIVFRRVKVTAKAANKVFSAPKNKGKSAAGAPKGDASQDAYRTRHEHKCRQSFERTRTG
jgi:hypothetical protein